VLRFIEVLTAGPYYAVLAVAIVLGFTLAVRSGRDLGFSLRAWCAVLASALVAGIAGSKMIFLDFQPVAPGEMTILGALILGIVTTLAVASAMGIGAWRALDAMSVPTLAAMAVGRIGCFFAGCCAGIETNLPWAVTSPRHGGHVHPVQLYEAAADVVLIVLLTRSRGKARDGQFFLAATLGYIGIRLNTEFFRDGREFVGPLNVVQWSLLVIGAGLALVAMRRTAGASFALPFRLAPLAITPPLGAFLMLQEPTPSAPAWEGPRSSLVLGGSYRNGDYREVVGEYFESGCDGDYRVPTVAPRKQRSADLRVGYQRLRDSGRRLTVEGRYLAGRDNFEYLSPGPVDRPPAPSFNTQAAGASLMSESPDGGMWQMSVTSGSLSKGGRPVTATVPQAAFRLRVSRNIFLHGNVAPKAYFPSLGEFSYLGLGVGQAADKPRFELGLGEGGHVDLTWPLRNTTLMATYRSLGGYDAHEGSSMVQVGIKRRLSLGR
jgi:phosphatidylglycerol:prolipoprotein diacylglycerol transferase